MAEAIPVSDQPPVGGRPRRIFDQREIVALRQQGLSFRRIARKMGLGDGTVRRAFRMASDCMAVRQNPRE